MHVFHLDEIFCRHLWVLVTFATAIPDSLIYVLINILEG